MWLSPVVALRHGHEARRAIKKRGIDPVGEARPDHVGRLDFRPEGGIGRPKTGGQHLVCRGRFDLGDRPGVETVRLEG